MIKLAQGDCMELMKSIPTGSVDMILCDPPYGTIKGMKLDGWKNDNQWDNALPMNEMFEQYERVLREQGVLVLFSQEPYTSKIRTFNYPNLNFNYPMVWVKNHFASPFSASKAPVSYFEDINVFRKKYNRQLKNPLRRYAKRIMDFTGKSLKEINRDLGHRRAEHFFYVDSMQFGLPTKLTYDELTLKYKLKTQDWFIEYEELKRLNDNNAPVFNVGDANYVSNVLKYAKDYPRYHPTQKPVDLLEHLITTYTKEQDWVLDNTMGGGSTGVAAINTNRNFIGYELNEDYFEVAKERINNAIKNQSKEIA